MNIFKKLFDSPKIENPSDNWNEGSPKELFFDLDQLTFCGIPFGANIMNCQIFGKTNMVEIEGRAATLKYPKSGYQVEFTGDSFDFLQLYINDDPYQPEDSQHSQITFSDGHTLSKESNPNDLVRIFGDALSIDIEEGIETVINHEHNNLLIEAEFNWSKKLKTLYLSKAN